MYVYDQANNLAKSIKESKEYLEYKKAKENLKSNPEMKEKIDEFEKIRYEVQVMSFQGEQDEEKNDFSAFRSPACRSPVRGPGVCRRERGGPGAVRETLAALPE